MLEKSTFTACTVSLDELAYETPKVWASNVTSTIPTPKHSDSVHQRSLPRNKHFASRDKPLSLVPFSWSTQALESFDPRLHRSPTSISIAAMASTTTLFHEPKPCNLLVLPAELRLIIYKYLLPEQITIGSPSTRTGSYPSTQIARYVWPLMPRS